jgi:hypothetical protein
VSGDHHPIVGACLREYVHVGRTLQAAPDMNRVVALAAEHTGEVVLERLVDEQSHWGRGSVAWSTAAAANHRACRTSCSESCGKSARISVIVIPSAIRRDGSRLGGTAAG